MIYCPDCGVQPVPEEDLPVLLPDDIEWRPTGESPLKFHPTWKHTQCPACGGDAERETDTMDTFMCSSWYPYRYLSPHFEDAPFDPQEQRYWMPVDIYTGGIEHATMHLIYVRFFTKAMQKMGLVDFDEPVLQLRNQGIILGEDFEKMSKSRGNVAAPDDLVARYGSDTMRAYLMFFARWDQGAPWSSSGIEGVYRWLFRVWTLALGDGAAEMEGDEAKGLSERDLERKLHQTIQSVTDDLENFEFNTVISTLMELTNALNRGKAGGLGQTELFGEAVDTLIKLIAPVAPHIAEEIWMLRGHPYSVHQQSWPQADEEAAAEDEITLVIQVNGKVRDKIRAPADVDETTARQLALASESVQRHLQGEPKKVIYVPGRLINFVV